MFTIYKKFPESPVGNKIEHDILRNSSEKFLEGRERLKRFSHFYFFGKWNLFVQMVKAIPGQNFFNPEFCVRFAQMLELAGLQTTSCFHR